MKITLNGKEESFTQEKLSVSELLTTQKVESPDMVSVQLNGAILKREAFDTTYLSEEDTVRFLYFMGGG